MAAVIIAQGVYWVGVQDPNLRVFDIIMNTEFGTSYGAYLIKGTNGIALIDTVKEKFWDEYIDNITSVADLSEIKYLIINHTEPDHSGCVSKLIQFIPGLKIVTSANAAEFLQEIINGEFEHEIIGKGLQIELGGKTLKFISAMLLHWPDNIYTYLKEDQILFSGDSFGSHYADDRIFNDLIEGDLIPSYKYYFDMIMGPFKPYVIRALAKLSRYETKMICPGHGPVIRANVSTYIELYRQWAESNMLKNEHPKVVIAYVSAYGYTKRLAQKIAEAISKYGDIEVQRYDLLESPEDQVLQEMQSADGILIGSPTINKDTLPPIWSLLNKLSPTECTGIKAAAFGSYGWSGEAVPNIEARLRMLRLRILPGLRMRLNPGSLDLAKAENFGKDFARAILGEETLLEPNLGYQIRINPNFPLVVERENYPRIYSNKDIVVYWNPARCTHDTNCFSSLGTVFDPEKRPWVNIDGDKPQKIIETINSCPSGALKYSIPEGSELFPDLNPGPGSIDYDWEKRR